MLNGRADVGRAGKGPDGVSVFAQFTGNHHRYDENETSDGYRGSSYGATVKDALLRQEKLESSSQAKLTKDQDLVLKTMRLLESRWMLLLLLLT